MTTEEKELIHAAMALHKFCKTDHPTEGNKQLRELLHACSVLQYLEEMKYPKIVVQVSPFQAGQKVMLEKAYRVFPDGRQEPLSQEELKTLTKRWFPVP